MFGEKAHQGTAEEDGKWTVTLDPRPANSTPVTITVAGSSTIEIRDVLVGEVWICSGQSNMGWSMNRSSNGDLDSLASDNSQLRLITVPRVGTQELQNDFEGAWSISSPASTPGFSAVGYHFGRYLQEILDVPVGLINNAWGGSAAEAWIRRDSLENNPLFADLMQSTEEREERLQSPEAMKEYEAAVAEWEREKTVAETENLPIPRRPNSPESWLSGNQRPGNIFSGVLHPTIGYGIRGAIWYQGESNASRAHQYRKLFPFLIEEWRKEWGQGDFPFYWVQLADFRKESKEPAESDWAELREAQTRTLSLPNTGQAVIIDIGEGNDIHPRNKHEVGARLARWALARDYGFDLAYRSPEFADYTIQDDKVQIRFNSFGSTLRTVDTDEVLGFAICGNDRVWHWAQARLLDGESVEVFSEAVSEPVAVRYAWGDNPVCNLVSTEGLPVTPFRTDDFPMLTGPKD